MKYKFAKHFAFLAIALSATASINGFANEQLLNEAIEYQLFNEKSGVGIAGAIIEDGKVTYINHGLVNKSKNTETSPDHLFEIGSISKTFTTTALASMVKEGKVKLSDPAQKYLPGSVKMPTFDGQEITLLSLANHTSALPRLPTNMEIKDPSDPYAYYTTQKMYEFLSNYKLTRAVGDKAEYSNLGMGLLGHILTLIDGKSYEQVIMDRITKPLKMNSTYVDIPQFLQAQTSDGHDGKLEKTKPWQLPTMAGAGALKSNVKDMVNYVKANMAVNPLPMFKLAQKPTAPMYGESSKIGLGWITNQHESGSYTWHNGGTGGFRSFVGFDREKQKAIVLLANSVYSVDELGAAYLVGKLGELVAKNKSEFRPSKAQLDNLVGNYPILPNFSLTVTHDGSRLYIQATGQDKFPVFATSATKFFYKVVQAEVEFDVDMTGNATAITLFQGGQKLTGQRQSLAK